MHVLLATDGSASSIAAAERASQILRPADHVTLLCVVSQPPPTTVMPGADVGALGASAITAHDQEAMWASEMAAVDDELARTAARLTSTAIDKRVEVGDVGGTVCRVAAELKVDVIVVGSHGRGGIGRLLLGSASSQIVSHAPCPVLVVRPEPTAS